MSVALTLVLMAMMLSLSTCTFVALDVLMRPAHYVAQQGRRGLSVPLESLTQRLLPRLGKQAAYRIVGATVALITFGLALLICLSAMTYFWTE